MTQHRNVTPGPAPASSEFTLPDRPVNRRSLLGGAAALGAAATLPRVTFAQESTPVATPAGEGTLLVPGQTHYPSGRDGVPDAYTALPEPFVSSNGPPGTGSTVRVFCLGYAPPPVEKGSNRYWQELERRLGVTWEIDITPQPNYGEKSAAYFAGGDLPDLFYINPGQNAAQQYQAMAQGAFLDLTPFLTGDALQQFPNLAAIPQYVWDNMKFQGQILGVPAPHVARFGNVAYIRTDWADRLGMTAAAGPDQVRELLRSYTTGDPDANGSANTWGMGRFQTDWGPWDNRLSQLMHRAPYNWRQNPDGTMTFQAEAEEYRQTIDWLRQVYNDGSYHPDSPSMTVSAAVDAFVAGQTGLHSGGFLSFWGSGGFNARQRQIDPNATIAPLYPVGADGQPGHVYNTPGFFGFTGIPSSISDESRILELLGVLNYLASPFGSEEHRFLNYGLEGIHHDLSDTGAPIVNDTGRAERADLIYLMPPLPTLYYPEEPELSLTVMDAAIRSFDLGIDDPSLTLYSPANVELGAQLLQFGIDSVSALVTGRQSWDQFDAFVQEWRDRGGDQIRQEFEEALQERG